MPNLPLAMISGHPDLHTIEELQKAIETVTLDQAIIALTEQPQKAKRVSEPGPEDTVFEGTFEEVNRFFYEN